MACTTRENPGPALPMDSYRPVGAPPPYPSTADPPQRAEVGGWWSWLVLEAERPGYIPPIDLPTATKAQLQKEGVLSPHEGPTSSTQLG